MSECYFKCGKRCTEGIDWECTQCGIMYHFVCKEPPGGEEYSVGAWTRCRYKCVACGTPFDQVTVGFWACSAYKPLSLDERYAGGAVFDVKYVRNGEVVAIQAFHYTTCSHGCKQIKRFAPMITTHPVDREQEEAVIKEWYSITRAMNRVKPPDT